ncbi:MAG TPA: 5'/3'-nucleotidase SurE [Aliidongia sp.]|nr:5'/3'-nucleotidase SurE [Aliidongia sp.]
MFDQPLDLAKARILLSNDDGIAAPGLKALERAVRKFAKDVWVVAPEVEQSGAAHSLTLRHPLRLRKLGTKRFAVDGTPTDCVMLALREVMKDKRPTLLISGINFGGNMGEDVTYSGTVAAAMEGTLLGVPSIAFSLHVTDGVPRWDMAAEIVGRVVPRLITGSWPPDTLMNVNIPNLPVEEITGIRATAQGRRQIGDNIVKAVDPRGRAYYWIGPIRNEAMVEAGTDIGAVGEGAVSVTPIHLDLTHQPALDALREVFP